MPFSFASLIAIERRAWLFAERTSPVVATAATSTDDSRFDSPRGVPAAPGSFARVGKRALRSGVRGLAARCRT